MKILREKTFWAVLVAVLFITGIITIRPVPDSLSEKAFWAVKVHNGKEYDVVLAGDSRVGRGLSPDAMEPLLPEISVFNTALHSAGFSNEFLDFIEGKVKKDGKKVIVLGLSPRMFLESSARNEQLKDIMSMGKLKIWRMVNFDKVSSLFRPIIKEERGATVVLNAEDKLIFSQEFHNDGWIATWMQQDDPKDEVSQYKDLFSKEKVISKTNEVLLDRVKKWSDNGYTVIAFRTPTSERMVELEDDLSGFSFDEFIKRFRSAGGKWFEFESSYRTYDGEHLFKESALEFSRDLALKLLPIIKSEFLKINRE